MKVLVLGAGGAAANGFTRALQMAGTYVTYGTNCSEDGLALAETDYTYPLPHADDKDYAPRLLELCDQVKPDLVHAQNDEEVWMLSLLRDELPVFLPRPHVIKACQDKWKSHCFWRDNVPQPETRMIEYQRDVEEMFEKFKRVWLRSTRGAGGAGSIVVDDPLFAQFWIDMHDGWGKFTAAKVLKPDTATWTGLYKDGKLVVGQGRLRLSWAYARNQPSGVSGITGVGETVTDDDLTQTGLEAVLCFDRTPHGLYGVDCALDGFKRWNPTEINIGRFHTTVPEFFAMAGMNIADLYCRVYAGEDVGKTPPLPEGKRWLRLMDKRPVLL